MTRDTGIDAEFEDRERVHRYAFESEDRSWVQGPFNRFVNEPLLRLLPATLHPNVLTLVGHVAQFAAFFVLFPLFDLPLDAPGRTWRPLTAAALLLVYCIADSLDGLHARKLGRSNPLGDFLDHGLDTFAGLLVPLGGLASYGATADMRVTTAVVFAIGWWANNLDRRATKRLVLPAFGAMEANFLTIGVHVAAALVGPSLWGPWMGGYGLLHLLFAVSSLGYVKVAVEGLWKSGPARGHVLRLAIDVSLVLAWYAWAGALKVTPWDSVAVPLLIGVVAAVHTWDLLRNILLGTRWPVRGYGLSVALALPALSLLVPMFHLPLVQESLLGVAFLVASWRLARQLGHTSRFVVDELRTGVLRFPAA